MVYGSSIAPGEAYVNEAVLLPQKPFVGEGTMFCPESRMHQQCPSGPHGQKEHDLNNEVLGDKRAGRS
jgi:hypothetical protein